MLRNSSFIVSCIMAAALALLTGPAHAVPVSYNESTDGDLDISVNFVFDAGANEISGNTQFEGTISGILRDIDDFTFDVQPGQSIDSITYEFSNVLLGPDTTVLFIRFNPRDAAFDPLFTEEEVDILNGTSPVSIFDDGELPLLDGAYSWINNIGVSGPRGGFSGGSWDYTFTFDVSGETTTNVSEPTTLAILGLGLVGLGFARRRRSA